MTICYVYSILFSVVILIYVHRLIPVSPFHLLVNWFWLWIQLKKWQLNLDFVFVIHVNKTIIVKARQLQAEKKPKGIDKIKIYWKLNSSLDYALIAISTNIEFLIFYPIHVLLFCVVVSCGCDRMVVEFTTTVQVETWYDRCPTSDVSDLTCQTLGRTEPGNKIPV